MGPVDDQRPAGARCGDLVAGASAQLRKLSSFHLAHACVRGNARASGAASSPGCRHGGARYTCANRAGVQLLSGQATVRPSQSGRWIQAGILAALAVRAGQERSQAAAYRLAAVPALLASAPRAARAARHPPRRLCPPGLRPGERARAETTDGLGGDRAARRALHPAQLFQSAQDEPPRTQGGDQEPRRRSSHPRTSSTVAA